MDTPTKEQSEALKVWMRHNKMNWPHEWVEDFGAINYSEFKKIWNKEVATRQATIERQSKLLDERISEYTKKQSEELEGTIPYWAGQILIDELQFLKESMKSQQTQDNDR